MDLGAANLPYFLNRTVVLLLTKSVSISSFLSISEMKNVTKNITTACDKKHTAQ
jgi:hypothetical protein